MSMPGINRAAVAGLIFLVGCGRESGSGYTSQGPLPPGYVAPASTTHRPLADHPEYVHWSRFPVGIVVIRKKGVSNDLGTVRVTTSLRLAVKTADKVVVESQVTVERPGNPPVENPPLNADFPAKFRVPEGMNVEQFSLPSLRAKSVGEETRQACGRAYATQRFTWDEVNETGPMKVTLWRNDDIPGRMLRQEIHGQMHDSIEEVVEIIQPDAEALGE
jgi:hypothetical protein